MKFFEEKQKRALIIFAASFLLGMLVSCSNLATNPPVTSILVDQGSLREKSIGVNVEPSAIPWLGIQQSGDWQEYLPYLLAGTLIVFLIIFILIIFTRTLQKRVNQRTRELNQALASLQKSERKYREIFNATTEAIFVHAVPGGQLLHVNELMLAMYGYETEEEVLFINMEALNADEPPYSLLDAQAKMVKALEEGPQVFEWLAKKKNGETFWTEISLRGSQIDGEGQVLAVVRDITKRKLADEELRKSEERYRTLFNSMLDGIYRSTHAGKFVDVNPAMVKMFGYSSREELLAVDIQKDLYFSPEERGSHILDTGHAEIDKYRMRRKDGSEIWVEDYGYYVHDEQGNILYHEGMLRDITERKLSEEALRESESLLKQAQVIADMGSYVLDFSSGIWKSSAILDKLFGIDDTYVRSVEGWRDLIHPDHRQQMTDYFANEVMGRRARFDREYKIVRKNDEVVRWVHGMGQLEVDAQDKLLKMHGVIQDITERKQTEQSLREHERQYRTLVEQIPAIVYIDDVSNGIHTIYVSPQIESILGFTPEEWRQKSPSLWDSLIHPDDYEWIDTKYQRCAQTGEPFEAEYRIKTADGRLFWLHDQAIMLRDENGNPQLIHGLMHDITERRQAEDELRQRVMELEMLYESGLAINQLLNPREIGQKVIELLKQKLGWHHTTIRLYHQQDESLELLAFNQPGLKNDAEWNEVEDRFKTLITHSNQGLSGWAVQHGQAIRSSDLRNDPRYVDTYPGLQSGLYVPMKLGDRVIGVISIESEQLNAFSSADEQLTATLANQAASALENARLFESERKQRQVSDALRHALGAGASMSASLDFETILDRLLETLERVVPFEGGSIMFVQPEKQNIKIARMRGYKKLDKQSVEKILNYSFDITVAKNLRWMFDNKQPLVISDIEQYPGWIRIQEAGFIRSWAGAPIIVNDEVIAFFSLDSSEPKFFTTEHAELLRAFTGQASLALQNARLFEQTEHRFREFAALYQTSNALSAENELTAMLQVIVEQAKKILNSASSGMYLYLAESNELELTVDTTSYLIIGTRLRADEGAAGYVAKTRLPLRLDDYATWEGRSPKYEGQVIHAILEVPMLYGGELIGVLAADETGDSKRKFTEADERLLSLFASQAAGAIHSARLRDQTARRLNQLQALHLIDRAISSSFDLRPILNTVIAQTISQLNVDAADILLYHPHLQTLGYVAGQGFRTRAIEQTNLRLGENFGGRAAFERRTIHVPNLREVERAPLLESESFIEYYAVPLIAKGEVKGVLEVFNRSTLPRNPEWLDFLETLAGQAAITIDQTQLFDDLQRANLELIIAYDATIEGWARAMDLRDKETESHTRRVTELTLSLAKALGIKDSDILHIRRGALLHDIGKMGVPDNILLKEGDLTEEEWELMHRHPKFAYEMLQPIKYLRQSLDIPYCHHEKWGGTGYPRGLKGEQIPLAARIFAIADVWDAITSDRPYRKGWTKEEALAYIKEQSGKQFDPQVVDVFLGMFWSEEI